MRHIFASLLLSLACANTQTPRTTTPSSSPSTQATTVAAPKEDIVRFLVVGDNDFHGSLDGRTLSLNLADKSSYAMTVGGAEYIAAYYQRLREEYGDAMLLLAGGDLFQGSLVSNRSEGLTTLSFLNSLRYDAVALGNHEFDYGPVGEPSVPREGKNDDPFGALKLLLENAKFPFLGANVREKASGKLPPWKNFSDGILLDRQGVKIGILGLSTEETPTTTQPPNVESLQFQALADSTTEGAKKLRAEGAEIVVLVAHVGTACEKIEPNRDDSSCSSTEELSRLLAELPKGTLDAAVTGHTHKFLANMIHGVPVIQSGSNGMAFGRIELFYDRAKKQLVSEKTKIYAPQMVCREVFVESNGCDALAAKLSTSGKTKPASFFGKDIVPDAAVTSMLRDARAEVEAIKTKVIGSVANPILRSESAESTMGNLITDLMRAATKTDPTIPDADIAIQNSGGIRADFKAGTLTYGDLFEVLPFENVLVTLDLNAAQLRTIVEISIQEGRLFQYSGMRVVYKAKLREGKTAKTPIHPDDYQLTVLRLETPDGKPLSEKKTYTVVWNDFLANGGNGMKKVTSTLGPKALRYHYNLSLRDGANNELAKRKNPLNESSSPLLDPKKPRNIFEME